MLPDLNPYDFYLWGYLKDRVFQTYPQTIFERKQAIEHEIFFCVRRSVESRSSQLHCQTATLYS
jgi:hypothetical protein